MPTSISNSDPGDSQGTLSGARGGRGGGAAGTRGTGGRARWAGSGSGGGRAGEEPEPGAPRRPRVCWKSRFGRPGRGAAGRESRAGLRGLGSCQTRLVSGPRRPAPPPPRAPPRCGRAASRPHTARRRGNGWNSSRGAALGLPGGWGADARGTVRRRCGALARADPRSLLASGRPEHVRCPGSASPEIPRPGPAQHPAPFTCLWLRLSGSAIWGAGLQPCRSGIRPSASGMAHRARDTRGPQRRRTLRPRSEAPASPSLRFWKALATDISKCPRPGLCGWLRRPCFTAGVESKAGSWLGGRG